MRKRGLLVVLVFLTAGACLWWVAGRGRPQESLTGAPARDSTDGVDPAALLAEPARLDLDVAVGVRTAADESSVWAQLRPHAAVVDAAKEDVLPAEGTVLVRILRSDTGEPVPGERVALLHEDNERGVTLVEGSSGGFGDAPRANEGGTCTFRIPAGARAHVVSMRAFPDEEGRMLIEPLAVGETREVTLLMPVFQHWILVESASDGNPIPRAHAREEDGSQDVSTGPDGLVALWCSEWRNEKVGVEAEGYGPGLIALERGHERPADALVVRLSQAGCLHGQVHDAADAPIEGARVSVLASGRDLSLAKANLWDGGAFFAFGDRTWSAQTDASGAFTLRGLAPSIPLQLTVTKGARLHLKPPEPVQLEPGEEREVVYRLGAGAVVRGVVTDELGEPVPRCKLWLRVAAQRETFAQDYPEAERQLRSNTKGSFEIKNLPDGEWCVGPAPDSGYLPVPVAVQVHNGLCSEVVVKARASLFVEGHVFGPGGDAVPDLYLYSSDGSSAETGADGAFRLGPLAPGEVTIHVSSRSLVAREPLLVQAGQKEVVLRLEAGGRLSGLLVNAATGDPTKGIVSVSAGVDSLHITGADANGEFNCGGLRPGVYGVVAHSAAGDVGYLRSVLVPGYGEGPEDLIVKLAPGGQLALRFPATDEPRSYCVRLGDCIFVDDGFEGAEVITPHLPSGEITVELFDSQSKLLFSRQAVVRVGETLSVDLSKDP